MQKEITKTKSTSKKYGEPYGRKNLLQHGDIKEISEKTGLSYGNVNQQLSGYRKIKPVVKALADKLADATQSKIDAINNN